MELEELEVWMVATWVSCGRIFQAEGIVSIRGSEVGTWLTVQEMGQYHWNRVNEG